MRKERPEIFNLLKNCSAPKTVNYPSLAFFPLSSWKSQYRRNNCTEDTNVQQERRNHILPLQVLLFCKNIYDKNRHSKGVCRLFFFNRTVLCMCKESSLQLESQVPKKFLVSFFLYENDARESVLAYCGVECVRMLYRRVCT